MRSGCMHCMEPELIFSFWAIPLSSMGIKQIKIVFRSPWQNGYCEWVIGSIRRECCDHIIVFSEKHLRRALEEYWAIITMFQELIFYWIRIVQSPGILRCLMEVELQNITILEDCIIGIIGKLLNPSFFFCISNYSFFDFPGNSVQF